MTDKNNASAPAPDENTPNRHLERVVDELRMVLSDLHRSPKNPDLSSPEPEKKAPLLDENSKKNLSEPETISFPPDGPHLPESTPLSSDADFWNGNVLGWPNSKESMPENLPNPLNALADSNPVDAFSPVPAENPQNLSLRDPVDEINMEESSLEPKKVKSFIPPFEAAEDNLGPWGAEEPFMGGPQLPEAPLSPLELPSVKDAAPVPVESQSPNPFSPTFMPAPEEPGSAEPTPMAVEAESSPVPIPQTLNKKPEPPKVADPNLNLESPDLKPQGLIQIACIYPEGQEKLGQTFVSKLREMGEKSKKTLNLQAVFVHPWTSDKVDITAWKKSALLSGADVMFVLVSKGNAASLKTLTSDNTVEIKSRTVYLEQIPMKALYADILVELQRGK